MRRTEPLRLNEIIEKMIQNTGLRPEMHRHTVQSLWAEAAGPHIAAYTRQVYFDKKLLHVHIDSASLKEELGYLRESLRETINTLAGEEAVENIIIH